MRLVLNSQEMVSAIVLGLVSERRWPQARSSTDYVAVFVKQRKRGDPPPDIETLLECSDAEYTVMITDEPEIIKKIKEKNT